MKSSTPSIVADDIARLGGAASGALQDEAFFARLQRALEEARGEYGLRRLSDVDRILEGLIAELRERPDDRYALLLAAALALQGRLHWRRAEAAHATGEAAEEQDRRAQQAEAFAAALRLFRKHEGKIGEQSRLWTDYGIALFRSGDFRGAIRVLQQARAIGATPAEAFGYLGLAHGELGESQLAVEALKKGLQLDPSNKVLLSALAKTLDKEGHRSEAARTYYQAAIAAAAEQDLKSTRELLEDAVNADPENAPALSMLVLLLRSRKEEAEAEAVLDRTFAKDPEHPTALGLRGMIRRDRGETEAALEDFRRAEAGSVDLAWVWLEHARTLAQADQDAARDLVNKAALLLGDRDARVTQARTLVEAYSFIKAVTETAQIAIGSMRDAAAAVAKSPVLSGTVRRLLQRILGHLGVEAGSDPAQISLRAAPDQALELRINQVVELAKSNPEQAITELRNAPDTEIALYRQAIASPAVSIKTMEGFARLLLERENYSEAAAVLENALRIAPDSSGLSELVEKGLGLAPDTPSLLNLKARLLDEQGDLSEAIRFYRRAVRAAPDDDELLKRLTDALHRAGRTEAALDELDRKLSGSGFHGVALATKGRLLLAVEQLREAEPVLRDAEAALANVDPRLLCEVRVNLGEVLRRLDRYQEARDVFERAIAIDNTPSDARAYQSALLIEIAEYDSAIKLLAEEIERLVPHQDDAAIRQRLGWLWSAKGWCMLCTGSRRSDELKEVEDTVRAALRLTPNDPQAQKNLGWLLLRDSDPERREEGRRLVTQLIESGPARSLPVAMVGWGHYLVCQYELAEYWLRYAIGAQPAEINPQFDLGLVLLAAGRNDEAKTAYNDAAKHARDRSLERQRGLFHVALIDVISAAEEWRFDGGLGRAIAEELRNGLREAGFSQEKLAHLRYPAVPLWTQNVTDDTPDPSLAGG
jgi:tetratricopeptide (TPR) repeat protein